MRPLATAGIARIEAINSEWLHRRFTRTQTEGRFIWPSTDAKRGRGVLDPEQWIKEGLLSFMGYHVGLGSCATKAYREILLSAVFACHVPPVFSDEYIREWGQAKSAGRLQKMAEALAAFTRNARRQRGNHMDSAIRDWESDLEFLYYEYYIGKFDFAWPTTKI